MSARMLFPIVVVVIAAVNQISADEWTYNNQDQWVCDATKMRQSPIDIKTSDVIYRNEWGLQFINYAQEVKFNIKNTRHSVSLKPIRTLLNPSLRVNWIEGGSDYELKEIHFHWGDGVNKGSEHEINDRRAAAEMHMVHYRKGLNASQIGNIENSVVVVGVFIESDLMEHNKLESLVSSTSKVNGTDNEAEGDKPEYLINLLPDNKDSFFTYNGSLTTPPCYEVVTWVIMSQPVYLSQAKLVELSNFRKGMDGGAMKGEATVFESIGPNFRDIQPLLNRPVYSSYNISTAIVLKGKLSKIRKSMTGFAHSFERIVPKIRSIEVKVLRKADRALKRAKELLHRQPSKPLLEASTDPDTTTAQAGIAETV